MTRTNTINIDSHTRNIIATILLLADFISLASQTMIVTALPIIQQDLHVSLTTAQWLTTGYTLILGLTIPLFSNIYDKYTDRGIYLSTVGLFIVGTTLGCVATNFPLLLLARLTQAAAGGVIMSLQMTTMISIFPIEKRGTVLGMTSLIISTAPAIGPTLSGFLLEYLSWRWLFISVLPFMIFCWAIGYLKLANYSPTKEIHFDYPSIISSLAGTGLALGSLTVFQTKFWVGLGMLIIGLICIWWFINRQLHLKSPMLKVTIFKYSSFRLMTIIGLLAFMIMLGTEQVYPIFTEKVLNTSSLTSGLILFPGALANGIVAFFAGRLYDQYGFKWLIISGSALIGLASIPLLFISSSTSILTLTMIYIVRLIGNALIFSPALTEAFSDLNLEENSHGTALNNTVRQIMGSVSVTMMVVITDAPASIVQGAHWAFGVTLLMVVILMIVLGRYLTIKKQH